MVGPTIVESGDRIDNDNKKKVGVLGMYNFPLIEWTRELKTDSAHAGENLMPPTGAGGEDYRQLAADKSPRANAFMEWDPGQAAGVSTDQAAGDTIIIIPHNMNKGAFCRNIPIVTPGGNVDAETTLCTGSGTAGSLDVVTEATFINASASGGFVYQNATWGTNAAAGNMDLNSRRLVAALAYYLANPSAAFLDVVYIL